MPRISNFEFLTLRPQPVIRLTRTTAVEALPQVIGEGFRTLGAYAMEKDVQLCDIPFVSFRGDDPSKFLVRVSFPLAAAIEGRDEIEALTLPSCKAAFCMYLGDYDGIQPVYEEMIAWLASQGFAKPGESWEYYYNGQDYPREQLLTRLVMPLEQPKK